MLDLIYSHQRQHQSDFLNVWRHFKQVILKLSYKKKKKKASKLVSINLFLILVDAPWELGPSQVTRKFHVEFSIQ